MQSQTFVQPVAIGATVDLLENRTLADIDRRFSLATVSIAATQDTGDATITASVGTDSPIQSSAPNTNATSVNMRDDALGQFRVQGGDRIRLFCTNAGAGVTTVRVMITIG